MNKYFMILITSFCLIFIFCKIGKQEIRIEYKAFLEEFINHPDDADRKYKNTIIITSGEIAFVTMPKDGRNLNRTLIVLRADNFNKKKLEGDSVNIETKHNQ